MIEALTHYTHGRADCCGSGVEHAFFSSVAGISFIESLAFLFLTKNQWKTSGGQWTVALLWPYNGPKNQWPYLLYANHCRRLQSTSPMAPTTFLQAAAAAEGLPPRQPFISFKKTRGKQFINGGKKKQQIFFESPKFYCHLGQIIIRHCWVKRAKLLF